MLTPSLRAARPTLAAAIVALMALSFAGVRAVWADDAPTTEIEYGKVRLTVDGKWTVSDESDTQRVYTCEDQPNAGLAIIDASVDTAKSLADTLAAWIVVGERGHTVLEQSMDEPQLGFTDTNLPAAIQQRVTRDANGAAAYAMWAAINVGVYTQVMRAAAADVDTYKWMIDAVVAKLDSIEPILDKVRAGTFENTVDTEPIAFPAFSMERPKAWEEESNPEARRPQNVWRFTIDVAVGDLMGLGNISTDTAEIAIVYQPGRLANPGHALRNALRVGVSDSDQAVEERLTACGQYVEDGSVFVCVRYDVYAIAFNGAREWMRHCLALVRMRADGFVLATIDMGYHVTSAAFTSLYEKGYGDAVGKLAHEHLGPALDSIAFRDAEVERREDVEGWLVSKEAFSYHVQWSRSFSDTSLHRVRTRSWTFLEDNVIHIEEDDETLAHTSVHDDPTNSGRVTGSVSATREGSQNRTDTLFRVWEINGALWIVVSYPDGTSTFHTLAKEPWTIDGLEHGTHRVD